MASVGGVSSSSSIYGTRNVISGLASGMDTESMIENAVSAYKMKISSLQQKRTKLEWQQEAYRSMITKAAGISSKYCSYDSAVNLRSPSFFRNAISVAANGANAARVTASGKTNSTVQIDRVKQLATAARYSAGGAQLGDGSVRAEEEIDLAGKTTVSAISCQLQVHYGGEESRDYTYLNIDSTVYMDIVDKNGKVIASGAQRLVNALNEQIQKEGSGDKFRAELDKDGSTIKFVDVKNAGNSVRITKVLGDNASEARDNLHIAEGSDRFAFDSTKATKEADTLEYLKDATLNITLDGQTRSIKGPTRADIEKMAGETATDEEKTAAYVELLQERIDSAFGKLENGSSKLTVTNAAADKSKLQLEFAADKDNGSSFSVSSGKSMALGFSGSLSNNVNTSTKLKDLAEKVGLTPKKALVSNYDGETEVDIEKDGKKIYEFEVNGVRFEFDEDTTVETLLSRINSSAAGVRASYSQTTGKFTFEARETGSASRVEFSENMKAIFGDPESGNYTRGQDAIFDVTVNGEKKTLTRSSNSVDIDGLKVNLKGTFGYEQKEDADKGLMFTYQGAAVYGKADDSGEMQYTNADGSAFTGDVSLLKADLREVADTEAITFTSTADADKIIDTIKQFIDEYNALATEVKGAYSTLPAQQSNGRYYEPLTEDDEADMSDKAIEKWNEKAKTGMLFGDSDLSGFYQALTSSVTLSGEDAAILRSIGIEASYSNGLTTLKLDENKMRSVLETDPDRVSDIFTKSKDNGASSDGVMASLSRTLDQYTKTTGYPKGFLVEKAGHSLSPSNLYTNFMQQQLDALDDEIAKWQDKMSDRVDYYTSKFSKLEQLIANMNSQSSALSGMMGM